MAMFHIYTSDINRISRFVSPCHGWYIREFSGLEESGIEGSIVVPVQPGMDLLII